MKELSRAQQLNKIIERESDCKKYKVVSKVINLINYSNWIKDQDSVSSVCDPFTSAVDYVKLVISIWNL